MKKKSYKTTLILFTKWERKEKIDLLEEQLNKEDTTRKTVNIQKLINDALQSITSIGRLYKESETTTKKT